MILTEEEARTKWCPETTVFITPESTQWPYAMLDSRGAPSTHPEFTRCIASGCPVWQWFDNSDPSRSSTGYCGKAGKP